MAIQLAHTILEMRYPLTPTTPPYGNADIDIHMQNNLNVGWDLVNVTATQRDGGPYSEVTYTFFWRRQVADASVG